MYNLKGENKKLNSVVPVGALRQIGNGYMAFSIESFIDEIAYELGQDPLDFRLSLLNNKNNDVLIYPGSIIFIPQKTNFATSLQVASIWAPIISSIALSLTSLSVLNNTN